MNNLSRFTFVLILIFSSKIYAQNLTLSDLQTICNKSNWEYVNQYLMNKGWDFYDSEKGSSTKYNTITWSLNKSHGDNAEGWFHLYTYEGFPNKIIYSVFNKPAYSKIQNSLSGLGYKLTDSNINDNEITSSYSNNKFILKISTEKHVKKDDISYYDESITAYRFFLIKKTGIYDSDNGDKTEYWDGGDKVKAKYTLKDGKLNGSFKTFYYNGNIELTGSYTNGVASGNFIEYDNNGYKSKEYSMKNDKKNGTYIGYYYDEGELFIKITGNYVDDKKEGAWETIVFENGSERTLEFENYKNGMKNGLFQEAKGDSLIIGNYKNDMLHGEYKVYIDFSRIMSGSIIQTDISKLDLISEGRYSNDLKSGYWKNYDLTGNIRSEGMFLKGKKSGEWRYYYTNYTDDNGKSLPYSKQLYLIQNFSNGMLDGKSTRFSFLEKEQYPCSEIDSTKSSLDTCTRMSYQKVLETSYYKNDKLHGQFELKDSTGAVMARGSFRNDLKQGEWLFRYRDTDIEGESYYTFHKGSYIDDKREGKWIQYYNEDQIAKTFNYNNGELHGDYIVWNKFSKPRQKKKFVNGEFKELIAYDSLGINTIRKYEIYNNLDSHYKCRKTDYYEDGYVSQEYWLKKNGKIDHTRFELTFMLKTSKYSDGSEGHKDGQFKRFNDENKPLVIGKYKKENKVGLWTRYYYDQNVKIESNYKNDIQIDEKYYTLNGQLFKGDFIYKNEEDSVKEIRKIKNGLRNGKTKFININTGKTIRKEKYKDGIKK